MHHLYPGICASRCSDCTAGSCKGGGGGGLPYRALESIKTKGILVFFAGTNWGCHLVGLHYKFVVQKIEVICYNMPLKLGDRPLLVFTEWLAALAAEKQGEVMIVKHSVTNTSSKPSSSWVSTFLPCQG